MRRDFMIFGERLRYLIETQALKQCQVATDLHIAPSTLSGYLTGEREPDYGTLIGIAEYFEVTIDYLLGATNTWKNTEDILDVREGDLVRIYRCLQPEKQDLLIEQAHLYHKYDLKQKKKKI